MVSSNNQGSTPVIHDLFSQHNLSRFKAFLSSTGNGQGGGSKKGGGGSNAANNANAGAAQSHAGGGSHGAAGSYSRSPRFDGSGFSRQPSKEEVNARDRYGRTVLHLVASTTSWDPSETGEGKEDGPLDFLEVLLACPTVNVNLQDRESGWTALHRAVYAGNLQAARRLLLHPDVDASIRDIEGLTAFDVLNSTILGTNPEDKVDGLEEEDQSDPRRELVTWGANRNFVLGLQGDSDRHFPERVHLDRTATHASGTEGRQGRTDFESVRVIKIAMEKLHSGLLTDEPKNNFRLCGFGSTTGRLGHNSPHPQFSFEPLKDFAQQRVTDFALGQDHTILCTEKGDVWTFGLNAFSVLGYAVETTSARPGAAEEPVQATPKRLVGVLKKEFVIGVAASRYHCAVFTADSLFTWGKNNGQLGYPSNATPIQHTPRKCAQITQPIKQIAATEVATVCLLEGGEVWVLHKDTNFKVTFPTTRFPTSMQVYRPPEISARPIITKVGGSGTTFIAVSSMGDVFSWQLENPSLETPSSATNLARDVKPTRVWDERKSFTAATDACVANDTIIVSTRSGHVYVRHRKKELTTVKGFELRSSTNAAQHSNRRSQYKVTRVANLQRVVSVAVSSSGGFGAIRSDAPLLDFEDTGEALAESLMRVVPHYKLLDTAEARGNWGRARLPPSPDSDDAEEEEEDIMIEQDSKTLNKICHMLEVWDSSWTLPSQGSDILLVAGTSGVMIPAHTTILRARSPAIATALLGDTSQGILFTKTGTNTLLIPGCSPMAAFILLHYFYTDQILALYDGRIFHKVHSAYPYLQIQISVLKKELQGLSTLLKLPALTLALVGYGKTLPPPTLATDVHALYVSDTAVDVIILGDGREYRCHSAILRARCPFFEAMFDDPDWYLPRREDEDDETGVVRVDLSHLRADVLDIVLESIYTDSERNLFREHDFTRADEMIDFVMLVMSASNELLLDGLKAACSHAIRPLINLHTVCSILTEAVFYEAHDLATCCMQYICCNIETVLEQHLLDPLSEEVMARLAAYCRTKQLDRLPRTARSLYKLAELREKYADWLKDLDIPRATGGYRRFNRQAHSCTKSPILSPQHVASSFRKSSSLSSSPTIVLSPPVGPVRPQEPVSPNITASAGPSPLVQASTADDSIMFDMDDLHLEDRHALPPAVASPPAVRSAPATGPKLPWQSIPSTPAQPQSLRDIMAQDTTSPSVQAPPPRSVKGHPSPNAGAAASTHDSPLSPPSKMSQKDRKKQMQQALGQSTASSPTSAPGSGASPASSPWKPVMPAAWQPPTAASPGAPAAIPGRSIQSEDWRSQRSPFPPISESGSQLAASPSGTMLRRPSGLGAGRPASPSVQGIPRPDTPGRATPTQAAPSAPPVNPASAVGAPVITPTRLAQKRTPSSSYGVPEIRSHDVPWVNYTSTVVSTAPQDYEGGNRSFASIQSLQATEREALRKQKGPMSLAEIQQEENERREEAAFLAWFEEESQRAQAAAGSTTTTTEGGSPAQRGKGRGRGTRRGSSTMGSSNRGVKDGTPEKPQKKQQQQQQQQQQLQAGDVPKTSQRHPSSRGRGRGKPPGGGPPRSAQQASPAPP